MPTPFGWSREDELLDGHASARSTVNRTRAAESMAPERREGSAARGGGEDAFFPCISPQRLDSVSHTIARPAHGPSLRQCPEPPSLCCRMVPEEQGMSDLYPTVSTTRRVIEGMPRAMSLTSWNGEEV